MPDMLKYLVVMKENEESLTTGYAGMSTRKEILQQPLMWEKTYGIIRSRKDEITGFLGRLPSDALVILTGAGSSAFIGNAVVGIMAKYNGRSAQAVPTTELITHPDYYLLPEKSVLLVSFARSGNSPESMAAVGVVDSYCRDAYHIIITCNENGELYRKNASPGILKILLPPETNDTGLAMTSSFSSMMLAFILTAKINDLQEEKDKVTLLAEWGRRILENYDREIKRIAGMDFSRAVFLGSGPLRGTAEESHLKLQELTDGAVICTFNSFLGFRHGPRAVVNDHTLLVYLFSDDIGSRDYEYDLVKQINKGNKGVAQISVAHEPVDIENVTFDLRIDFGTDSDPLACIEYLCIAEVLISQLLGFHKSLYLGLDPDNPSRSGSISRVVEGVKIYKYNITK
jgi:tagatose-6-phosphate ketose/aldose isomerase